ncbi:MAG: 30S ribosomal protein S9 [Candidatus Bilamarchaeum sp.]|jgi:small subunit ribosomal protein S9
MVEEKKTAKKRTPKPKEAAEEKVETKAVAPEVKPVEAKVEAPKAEKKKRAPKKAASGNKVFVARGKRKLSIARATIKAGKGVVRVNSKNVTSLQNSFVRDIITEPLRYIGPESNTVDIAITVSGGGMMGQAQAARTAIANALTMYFDSMNLSEKFDQIDRSLLIEDTRRVESKKFRGPKARARFQKSYR